VCRPKVQADAIAGSSPSKLPNQQVISNFISLKIKLMS
jgi:hypothetical protein